MKFFGTDLGLKHVTFEVDGERHWVLFRFSHRKGVTGPFVFDGHEAKIIDAYPPLHKVVKQAASIAWGRVRWAIRKFLQKKNRGEVQVCQRRKSNS